MFHSDTFLTELTWRVLIEGSSSWQILREIGRVSKVKKETKTTLCQHFAELTKILIVLYHDKKSLIFLTEESSNDITNYLNYDNFPQFKGLYYKE